MKEENKFSFDSFKEKLDNQYTWPSLYTFKFIVPQGNENEVRKLFPETEVTEKKSRKGNYVSLTARMLADSSEAIIGVYQKAQHIKGLIAL